MNYFELFELPIKFTTDKSLLKKKYYQLSKKYHPDFFDIINGISELENLQLSSTVNEGYKILQNEYATLGYILKLKGLIQDEEKYNLSPSFLMEVMELNEDLQETSLPQLNALGNEIIAPVAHLFVMEEIEAINKEEWEKIKEYYYQQKYLNRLQQRINGVTEFE
jgi:molecular chaperone HscB